MRVVGLFASLVSLTLVSVAAMGCGAGDASGTKEPGRAPLPFDAGAARDAAWPQGDPVDAGAASDDDAGPTTAPPPPEPPFVAPEETWTWVDVPGMECANGSGTGVGVNLTSKTGDVLVFLQGGGACWDAATCWGTIQTSFYLNGFGKSDFELDPQRALLSLPLDRSSNDNPFRDMSFVYVPYCTGDVHAGNREQTYVSNGVSHVTKHVGSRNFDVVIRRLLSTFPNAKRVWVAGDSAGGFGAALNFGRVQNAFPYARVGVLDDSGQPVQPSPERWKQWKDAWGLTVPADCPACADQIGAYVDYYRDRFPDNRFALVSYTNDAIISTFMGLGADQFATELGQLTGTMDHGWPYSKYYLRAGISHVGLILPPGDLVTWLKKAVDFDPTWSSVRP